MMSLYGQHPPPPDSTTRPLTAPPPGQHRPPWTAPSPGQHPPDSTTPSGQHYPWAAPPAPYQQASYWNAFLVQNTV